MTRTRIMRAAAVTASVCSTIAVLGCTHHAPDTAACKKAMTAEFTHALAHPNAPAGTKPPACHGVPDTTLTRLAHQILDGQ